MPTVTSIRWRVGELALLIAPLVLGCAESQPGPGGSTTAPARQLPNLDGTWTVVEASRDGKASEVPPGARVILEKGGFKIYQTRDSLIPVTGNYSVDHDKSPAEMNLAFSFRVTPELYYNQAVFAVEGDTLKLCIAAHGKPRPTELAAKPGMDWAWLVLQRVP